MTWQESAAKGMDDPDAIVEGCIDAQRKLLTGYGGNPNVNRELLREANEPNQCAISLTGEPAMYPHLDGLIQALEKKSMGTFLVTNGTFPEAIERLQRLPTQLYVSVTAPDKQTYDKLCSPFGARGWTQLQKTLELFPSLSCRTVIRHTLVKGWNMHGIDAYAKLDLKASPAFIEAKGFSFVGESRFRMKAENMPTHQEIREWAQELASETGYSIWDEQVESRVVLLGRK
jgi:tRNA wybutosine-synthesizing protein 1